MSIKISLSKVASYKDITTLETDKKIALIYGLNGTGKSTLSNYLYDRYRADYAENCQLSGMNNANILVYNTQFVRDYFHESEKLKGVFTISKENKQAEQLLEKEKEKLTQTNVQKELLEHEIQEIDTALNITKKNAESSTWEIKAQYSGGDRIFEFCLDGLKGSKERLFDSIIKIQLTDEPIPIIQELKREIESIKGTDAVRLSTIPKIELSTDHIELAPIFKQAIIGNQSSTVAALIAQLENADWVKTGIEYLDTLELASDQSCPFCQSKTITDSVSKAIRNYFDESYTKSLEELRNL